MSTPASGGSVGVGTLSPASHLMDTRVDPPCPVLDGVCHYGSFLDSRCFVEILMNGANASV